MLSDFYTNVDIPFTLQYSIMPKDELKQYYKWFMSVIPERLDMLINAVKLTDGYDSWTADFSPDSLNILGKWVFENVSIRKRTEEEYARIYDAAPEWFKNVRIEDWVLTDQAISIAFDVGIYLAQVFLTTLPVLKWHHRLRGSKKDINYGQPVLIHFGVKEFNPSWMAFVLVSTYADKSKGVGAGRLREVFDIWLDIAQQDAMNK